MQVFQGPAEAGPAQGVVRDMLKDRLEPGGVQHPPDVAGRVTVPPAHAHGRVPHRGQLLQGAREVPREGGAHRVQMHADAAARDAPAGAPAPLCRRGQPRADGRRDAQRRTEKGPPGRPHDRPPFAGGRTVTRTEPVVVSPLSSVTVSRAVYVPARG
ncbi:hypothetical protein GCM10010252_68270 [Streptomyces aureoverticillatus]|nr:hypothetical protein GCM10010252_68270 [Streptomyces aureoverticillatus]